jgi:hypothetical protein
VDQVGHDLGVGIRLHELDLQLCRHMTTSAPTILASTGPRLGHGVNGFSGR